MKKRWIVTAVVLSGIALAGVLAGPVMSDVEHPAYEALKRDGDIETRRYAPMLLAEVNVTGPRKEAIGDGFRVLADFIFGNNAPQSKIAMTAPVQQEASTSPETRIAMTAPVQHQALENADNSWTVSFIMPSEYSLNTLPAPNDSRIRISEVPPETFMAIRFSGASSDENVAHYEKQLRDHLASRGLSPSGPAKYAFYNPPWTLPALRRNEVMLRVDRP